MNTTENEPELRLMTPTEKAEFDAWWEEREAKQRLRLMKPPQKREKNYFWRTLESGCVLIELAPMCRQENQEARGTA
jgi:hypothetical protein